MSTIEKLIARFTSKPRDFSWNELTRLLSHFGYEERTGGGSRRKFTRYGRRAIKLHEPHPDKILKKYQMDHIYDILKGEKLV